MTSTPPTPPGQRDDEPAARATDVRLVTKRFGDVVAVDDVTVDVLARGFFALGPSGSGKTASLRVIAGMERPTAGRT